MSHPCQPDLLDVLGAFNAVSNVEPEKPERSKSAKTVKATLPVSIRVSAEEKTQLQQMAGTLAISAYIRQRLFGDGAAVARPKRYQDKQRQPKIDHTGIARLLGMFGQSELARSMLALSLAVQMGELEISAETENQIGRACDEIHEIRTVLVMALGIKPQGVCR